MSSCPPAFVIETKTPLFDAFAVAVIVYFKGYLKNIHFHRDSSWLTEQFPA
jgi:hypothetical protein